MPSSGKCLQVSIIVSIMEGQKRRYHTAEVMLPNIGLLSHLIS